MSIHLKYLPLFLFAALTLFMHETQARQSVVKPSSAVTYKQAFNAIEAGQCSPAEKMALRGNNPALNLVLKGLLMAQPGNDYSFDELAGFVSDHPDWYGLNGILMIAEQKIPSGASPSQIVNWFNAHAPLTSSGLIRFIEALDELGQSEKASHFIRDRWINKDFSSDDFTAFLSRFGSRLGKQDHHARLDRLLWDNNITAVRAMYPYIDPGAKAVAEARLALANQSNKADAAVAGVPASWQHDPGLLYERLRWKRKNNMDDDALDMLLNAPRHLVRPDNWWDERNILIRRMMERGDFRTAYKLAADHGEVSGFDLLQSEFLAGWLALRFLKQPDIAEGHFRALLENAATPISRARGAYWLGRTYEALGDRATARQSYETAAALNTTFYGQLAIARLEANPIIRSDPEPSIPRNVRSAFFARDSIKAIKELYRIGEKDLAYKFFKTVTDYAAQRYEYVLLMELAYELYRPDWVIKATKAAAQNNMLIGAGSFPVLSIDIPTPPDLAFTHALIRQESLFNASAGSSAGARGLMQLMPATAKGLCKKLDIRYSESKLTDPHYNLRLGTTFVQHQLDQFDGSIILALAAYNAGPGRVRGWIEQFGDPRAPNVDPIDWIEMMPIYETRNYVQRIIENLQFYRARLNGGSAQLEIVRDLKR